VKEDPKKQDVGKTRPESTRKTVNSFEDSLEEESDTKKKIEKDKSKTPKPDRKSHKKKN